jgi:hypothetical protein
MSEAPGGSTEREGFSDDVAQLIVAVRALIGGHWDLFRAELGAISRDAVGVLIGAIAVITLVTAALLALLIAVFMLLGHDLGRRTCHVALTCVCGGDHVGSLADHRATSCAIVPSCVGWRGDWGTACSLRL